MEMHLCDVASRPFRSEIVYNDSRSRWGKGSHLICEAVKYGRHTTLPARPLSRLSSVYAIGAEPCKSLLRS
jgi:hypothetical protein